MVQVLYNCFSANSLLCGTSNSTKQRKPHTISNKLQIWRFFLNASAGHWQLCGRPCGLPIAHPWPVPIPLTTSPTKKPETQNLKYFFNCKLEDSRSLLRVWTAL